MTLLDLQASLQSIAQRPNINVHLRDEQWHASVVDGERRYCIGIGSGQDMVEAIGAAVEDYRNELAKRMRAELEAELAVSVSQ